MILSCENKTNEVSQNQEKLNHGCQIHRHKTQLQLWLVFNVSNCKNDVELLNEVSPNE